jgi:N-acetylated-alpha-linked acidic dipeptidase
MLPAAYAHTGRMGKMADERTPLVSAVVLRPRERRTSFEVCRRFSAIALCSTLFWLLLSTIFATVLYRGLWPHHHYHHGHGWNKKVPYEDLKKILTQTPSSKLAEEWSRYYTAGPHLAGKNYSQVRCHVIM